jgi:hypothetical protein
MYWQPLLRMSVKVSKLIFPSILWSLRSFSPFLELPLDLSSLMLPKNSLPSHPALPAQILIATLSQYSSALSSHIYVSPKVIRSTSLYTVKLTRRWLVDLHHTPNCWTKNSKSLHSLSEFWCLIGAIMRKMLWAFSRI